MHILKSAVAPSSLNPALIIRQAFIFSGKASLTELTRPESPSLDEVEVGADA